ncbi:hypothetical protein Q757_00740 [Oenococcus alcoholitolerans]|uniref:Uncharacterized protein n=1 Tax=Oenococcus alcoholitolerans TaxID=931074 RepID=A0ABR4XTZ9_9LACO|nr:hypothetical protein Q757_00740 [Oenococcus alcoholitolerans]
MSVLFLKLKGRVGNIGGYIVMRFFAEAAIVKTGIANKIDKKIIENLLIKLCIPEIRLS